ncbi:MAG TPA: FMN-binding protein [Trebonia sp.]|jgi:uncharacterized protein with FMN-binding domain|nr:FMN-binding protein [Trebonia sp.]
MRRAILTIGGTAAGLAALLSFKTHTSVADVADTGTGSPAASASAPATPTGPAASPTTMKSKMKAKASSSPKAKASAGAGGTSGGSMTTRSVTGPVESTMYGPVQVKVTLDGSKITNVSMVQDTNDGQESQQIDSFAIPKLTAETLTAQSARIDSVSGATTTSQGYIGSLQSALDQAGA